jgi:Icc-related predicted phosphoesterase
MRIMIQGDSHGTKEDILPKIYKAGEWKIQHLLVVGDFGLWTHKAENHEWLDEINEAARINNLSVFAVGGNHENWDHWNWIVENQKVNGWGMARRRVLLAPKTFKWKWGKKQFVGAGGAVSIDKQDRIRAEQGGQHYDRTWGRMVDYGSPTGPKTLWWPNEELLDEDVDRIINWKLKDVDYLITHDCSNYTPWGHRLKPDLDSQIHRQRIDRLLKDVQPKMHFHGHMHEKYDWVNEYSGGGARTIGLAAFRSPYSYGVLDVESGEWFWPKEYEEALADRAARKAKHDEERYAKSGEEKDKQ